MDEFISVPIRLSHRLLNAGNIVLVTAKWIDNSTITTVAWHMPVSGTPKLISIALGHERYCLELIKKSKSFCINIPDIKLIEAVKYCGSNSGRNVDKWKETNFTPKNCSSINCFFIEECPAHIECELHKLYDAGDHTIVIGKVNEAKARKNFFTRDNVIDIEKFQLISHLGDEYFATLKLFKKE